MRSITTRSFLLQAIVNGMISRQRDYENVLHNPVIYTNYLEANATVGADTKVRLFEEGDYEVALDYQITKDKKT